MITFKLLLLTLLAPSPQWLMPSLMNFRLPLNGATPETSPEYLFWETQDLPLSKGVNDASIPIPLDKQLATACLEFNNDPWRNPWASSKYNQQRDPWASVNYRRNPRASSFNLNTKDWRNPWASSFINWQYYGNRRTHKTPTPILINLEEHSLLWHNCNPLLMMYQHDLCP